MRRIKRLLGMWAKKVGTMVAIAVFLLAIASAVNAYSGHGTGEVTLDGTGKLLARGYGNVSITLNGTVDMMCKRGVLVVTDNYGDVEITATGFGYRKELGEHRWLYRGTGSIVITGSDILVELHAQNGALTAKGTGSARLNGTGAYIAC